MTGLSAVGGPPVASHRPLDAPGDDPVDRRVAEQAQRSSDLRIRILFSWDVAMTPEGRPTVTEPIAIEALVDRARGATDPLLLALLLHRCEMVGQKERRCDPVDIARRWTVADTQNQVAWLSLSNALRASGDLDGARSAFRRAAEASTWREESVAITKLVADWLVREPIGMTPGDAAVFAIGKAAAVPFMGFHTIGAACKGAPERKDVCARIVETMARDTDNLMGLHLAAAYAARASLPATTLEAIRREADADQWTMRISLPSVDAAGLSDEALAVLASIATFGERRTYRRIREKVGVSDAEAARRYVASMPPEQIARWTTDIQPFTSLPRTPGW